MIDSNFDDLPIENRNIDNTLGEFHFLPSEKKELMTKLMKNGKTEEQAKNEVTRREAEITNRQAQAQVEKERKVA